MMAEMLWFKFSPDDSGNPFEKRL